MRQMRRTSMYLMFTVMSTVILLGVLLVPEMGSVPFKVVYIFLPVTMLCLLFTILSACIDVYKIYTQTESLSEASLTYSELQKLTFMKSEDVTKELFVTIIERCKEREQQVKRLQTHQEKFERWFVQK